MIFVPPLVAVNAGIFPFPEEFSPINVFELLQLYKLPFPVKEIEFVSVPLQNVTSTFGSIIGVGFTVSVKFSEVPAQLIELFKYNGVAVIVAVTKLLELLIELKGKIEPVPFTARPIELKLFTQE